MLKLSYVDAVEYTTMLFWRSDAAQNNDNDKRQQQENHLNQRNGWTNLLRQKKMEQDGEDERKNKNITSKNIKQT